MDNNITLKQADEEQELLPIVDEAGNVVGKATRRECHAGTHLLHPVVHLHVFNPQGQLYLQQRSRSKRIQPGKWDTAVGGHVSYGESISQALERETREELGLTGFKPIKLFTYVFNSNVESELVNAFYTVTSHTSFQYDPVEVDDGRFWTIEQLNQAIGTGVLTPNFEQEFAMLKRSLNL